MSLEFGSKKSRENLYGIDQEWIRENESREFKMRYFNQTSLQDDLLESAREIEEMLESIEIDGEEKEKVQNETNDQIKELKDKLSDIFESTKIEKTKQINNSEEYLREPSEMQVSKTEKQEIKRQLKEEKEKLNRIMEWAAKQPNKPTFTDLKGGSIDYPKKLYINDPRLIDYINSNYSFLGKVDEILSVSGYLDKEYDVKFDDGKIHKITIMNDKKQEQETNKKNELIKKIINSMDPEELEYVPLNDLKNRLEKLSIEELEVILNGKMQNVNIDETTPRHM